VKRYTWIFIKKNYSQIPNKSVTYLILSWRNI